MNSSPVNFQGQTGFTLLELLIAITIFSILSTITYTGLKTVLDTKEQTESHLEKLASLQIGLNLLQRDIEQAVVREVRDEFGDTLPAMRSSKLSGPLLEFTRGGYDNPLGLKRSNLQRVAYQLDEERLDRLTWSVLDRDQEIVPNRSRLLEKVHSFEINYYDQQMTPHQTWPPDATNQHPHTQYPLPKALEISLEVDGLGTIRRLLRVAQLSVAAK